MKTAIVTGGNSGMGKATVAALSDHGMNVIMLCRDLERGQRAYDELMEESERNIQLMICDLADMDSIRKFSEEFHEKYETLDVLVNNAGFISLKREETKDGLERQFGVNHIGHFLLTLLLLDKMQGGSRIINVASGAHKVGKIHFDDLYLEKGYNVIKAYSQSKLANIYFTRTLASKLKPYKISVNSCHPGAVATQMGIDRVTGFGKTLVNMLRPVFRTPEEGAATAIYLAVSDEVKGKSGRYYFNSKSISVSKRGKDRILAERLFEISEAITGCEFDEIKLSV